MLNHSTNYISKEVNGYERINQLCYVMHDYLNDIKDDLIKSILFTKIEEMQMWARKGSDTSYYSGMANAAPLKCEDKENAN